MSLHIRFPLRTGDSTTTGGCLVCAACTITHHDRPLAFEGDYATCPACGAGGSVLNDCVPAFEINGRQLLVSGARVHCQCLHKPVVIPSQVDFTIEVTRYELAEVAEGIRGAVAEPAEIIEEYFEITDGDGHPVDGYCYDLHVGDAQLARNQLLAAGKTMSVIGNHAPRLVMWLDKRGTVCT